VEDEENYWEFKEETSRNGRVRGKGYKNEKFFDGKKKLEEEERR